LSIFYLLFYIETASAQTSVPRHVNAKCGTIIYDIYYVNGVRFKVNCEKKDLVFRDSNSHYFKLAYNLNGLEVTNSVLDIYAFSPKQLKAGNGVITCKELLNCQPDSSCKYMVVEMNLKSHIYLNGNKLELPEQQKILPILKEADVKSIIVKKPFPLFFWDHGKVEITTVSL